MDNLTTKKSLSDEINHTSAPPTNLPTMDKGPVLNLIKPNNPKPIVQATEQLAEKNRPQEIIRPQNPPKSNFVEEKKFSEPLKKTLNNNILPPVSTGPVNHIAPPPQKPPKEDFPLPEEEETRQRPELLLIGAFILILIALMTGGIYYYYNVVKTPNQVAIDTDINFNEMDISQEPLNANPQSEQENKQNFNDSQVKILVNSKIVNTAKGEPLAETLTFSLQNELEPIQLILKDAEKELTLVDIQSGLNISIPLTFVNESTNFALIGVQENNAFQMALIMENKTSPDQTKQEMLNWEMAMVNNLKPLYLSSTITPPQETGESLFKNSSKFPNGRYVNLSENNSLDYFILSDKVIIGTHYSLLEKLYKLFE